MRTPAFALIILSAAALAQQRAIIEQGALEDLRGVTRIYVEVPYAEGTDRGVVMRNIISELMERLPHLKPVGDPKEAELLLVYSEDSPPIEVTTGTNPMRQYRLRASGYVFKPIGEGRARLVMAYGMGAPPRFERKVGAGFARAFVEEYVRVNGRGER